MARRPVEGEICTIGFPIGGAIFYRNNILFYPCSPSADLPQHGIGGPP